MPYKPLAVKLYKRYIESVGWSLEKGSIDWNLYTDVGDFVCSIIIAHGKNTKSDVTAHSVDKTRKAFKSRGMEWPPNLKSKGN